MARPKKDDSEVFKHTAFRCKQGDIDKVSELARESGVGYAVMLRELVLMGLKNKFCELDTKIRKTSSLCELELHARAGGRVWMNSELHRLHSGRWQLQTMHAGRMRWETMRFPIFHLPAVLLPNKWNTEPPEEFMLEGAQ